MNSEVEDELSKTEDTIQVKTGLSYQNFGKRKDTGETRLTEEMTNLQKEFGDEAHYIYKSHKKQVRLVRPNQAYLQRHKVGTAKS